MCDHSFGRSLVERRPVLHAHGSVTKSLGRALAETAELNSRLSGIGPKGAAHHGTFLWC